jgi:hypothetical protein
MRAKFKLMKVVDPHSHMPKEIKNALFESMRGRANGTTIHWRVGEQTDESDFEEVDDEDPLEDDADWIKTCRAAIKVDAWLMENFEKGEDILVLYWW